MGFVASMLHIKLNLLNFYFEKLRTWSKIVTIAQQTSEIVDMQCMKKEHQFSQSFTLIYKPHKWTVIKQILLNEEKKHCYKINIDKIRLIKDNRFIANTPGRMKTNFCNFTLYHGHVYKKLCTQTIKSESILLNCLRRTHELHGIILR